MRPGGLTSLTVGERTQFDKNGYLFPKGVFDMAQTERYLRSFMDSYSKNEERLRGLPPKAIRQGSRAMIRLRGSTWNHVRGYAPLVATAKTYQLTHPEVAIHWDKRSLQDFADLPVETLAEAYDLVMIDHPSVGTCEFGDAFSLDELLEGRNSGDAGASKCWTFPSELQL